MSEERILAAKTEVQRLLNANVIREVKYSEWLTNVILVPKKNKKMRMCICFRDLNKACKKDLFLLPNRHLRRQGSRMQVLLSPGLLLRIPPDLAQKRR